MTEIKCYCGHTNYCDCDPLPNLTATQWLFEKLWDTPKDKFEWYALLKEAEEKFQEGIEDAYIMGVFDIKNGRFNPREYYNETFEIDKRNITD